MDYFDIYNTLDNQTKNSADRQWFIQLLVFILCCVSASLAQKSPWTELYPFITIKNIWLLLIITRIYALIESIIFRITHIIPTLWLDGRYNVLVMYTMQDLIWGVGIQLAIIVLMCALLLR